MNPKNRKRGYTLIELLAVIAILAIILALSLSIHNVYVKNSKNKLKEMETDQLIKSGSLYYSEFKDDNDYVSYTGKDNIKYSCISVKSLIDKGYYKGTVSFLDEELTKDNTVIKVKEINNVPHYELITNYEKDKDCIYYDVSSELDDNTEIVINNNDDGNDISLSANISSNPSDKNSYIIKLKFSADVYEKIVNYSVPLYVLEVLDTSGSMSGKRYNAAKIATKSLSESLIKEFDESYVGLITFDSDVEFVTGDFIHSNITDSYFPSKAEGWTNILEALDLAYNKMQNAVKDEPFEPIKYVIFLTDGKPEAASKFDNRCNSYSFFSKYGCNNALIEYTDKIKNDLNATFVVIGYDINLDIYKTLASVDETGTACPDSDYSKDGKKYCYYKSSSSNISALFSTISNSIKETVRAQSISKSTVNIDFDKTIKIYDKDGNEITDLNIDINFDDINKEALNKEYIYYLNIDEDDYDKFTCDYEKNECSYDANLFDNYYIEVYDMEGNYLEKYELDSSPIISIKRTLKSYIN